MAEYRWRQKGSEVKELQECLIAKGYHLPKWGADGDLGSETWSKIEAYAGVDQFPTCKPLPQSVTDDILYRAPESEVPREFDYPEGYIRVKGDPKDVHGIRTWAQIDTIVLHQTGVWMKDTPDRFDTVNAHVGILRDHETPIVQIHDLIAYCYHANEANRFSIGFEINGCWPGLIDHYKSDKHSGIGPTEHQIQYARKAIVWVMDEVEAHGGLIKHILPHRVSNDTRRADPGEHAWQALGIWAQQELGLTDKGPGYCIGDGTPIPFEWDSRPAYRKYKY
jgi:hypothetical protein